MSKSCGIHCRFQNAYKLKAACENAFKYRRFKFWEQGFRFYMLRCFKNNFILLNVAKSYLQKKFPSIIILFKWTDKWDYLENLKRKMTCRHNKQSRKIDRCKRNFVIKISRNKYATRICKYYKYSMLCVIVKLIESD